MKVFYFIMEILDDESASSRGRQWKCVDSLSQREDDAENNLYFILFFHPLTADIFVTHSLDVAENESKSWNKSEFFSDFD